MEAAQTSARQTETVAPDNVRRCLVTGEMLPKDELVRFVVGPDTSIVPDLSQNLPGRGLWVKAERDAIETAAHKGLFAKAAKTSIKADPLLADLVVRLLRKRCLDYIGLAKRSGNAVLGQTQVEAALRSGKLDLLLTAEDASQTLDNRHKTEENRSFNRTELGAALGYEQLVYVGLKAHNLTEKLKIELMRLAKTAHNTHIT